jgi:hypothetical protein
VKTLHRLAIAVLWVAASRAAAQQPAVVLPVLTGHVRSVDGNPIAEAEVTVTDLRAAATRSDTRGAFSIPNVPKGIHTISVRRLGYLPTTATVEVPQKNDSLTIVLVPTRAELDTVHVAARVNVLAGVVVDEHDRPIAGALVDLGSATAGTRTTGDDGWFTFTAVRSGPTIIHVLKEGYIGTMQSVQLQEWRGVVVRMNRVDASLSANKQEILSGLGNSAQQVWVETQTRQARRAFPAVVITREELSPFGDLPLGEAIRRTTSGAQVENIMQATHNTACVLINGDRMIGQTSLDSYDTEDIEFVELYPPGTEATGTVAARMQIAGCSATRGGGGGGGRFGRNRAATAPVGPTGGGAFFAVVWLKN